MTMRTPSTLRRTVLLALLAALALFASACGSTQPIEVGGDETDESANTLDDSAPGFDDDDRNIPNPIPEPSGPEQTAEGDEPVEPIEVPGPDASGEFKGTESAEDLADYCASYNAINELGEEDPTSAFQAETTVTEMIMLANVLASSTPDHMTAGVNEMTKFLDTIAELAAAADWDPEWFAGSFDELFAESDIDFELVETFFDESDSLCLEPGDDYTTPDVLPVEPDEPDE